MVQTGCPDERAGLLLHYPRARSTILWRHCCERHFRVCLSAAIYQRCALSCCSRRGLLDNGSLLDKADLLDIGG